MSTNDERREVAERLRELEQGVIGALVPTGELAENILRAIDYGRSGAMTPYGCLADLIEPAPSCEFWDAEEQRCYSIRTVRPVDRDALLELADEMDEATCDKRGEMSVSLGDIWGWAECIHEALGVES